MKKTIWFAMALLMALSLMLSGCGGEPQEKVSYFAPGDQIVVNIADSYRLLKISPVLVLNVDVEADKIGEVVYVDYLTALQPLIRDVINSLARMKTEEEVKTNEGMEALRVEITQYLQNEMQMTFVTDVYFSDFVMQ